MDIQTTIVVLLIVISRTPDTEATYASETSLRSTLKTGYDTDVRPDSPTEVAMRFNIRSLVSLDVASESMGTSGWLTLVWTDSRLTWDASTYSGISALEVDWTWRPKFIVTNNIDDPELIGHKATMVRVYNTGTIRWLIPQQLITSCSVDITYFPFDSQSCYIEVMFWNSDDDEVNLLNLDEKVDTSSYLPNGEWDLSTTKAEVLGNTICCPDEQLPTFNITINFTRKRPYYVINLLLPSLLMSICIIWTFLLPVDSGERIGYSITIMLTYTVMMTITGEFLPTSSSQTPHISSYLLIVFGFSLTAVAITVVNVKLFFKDGCPPKLIQKFVRTLGFMLFCNLSCQKKNARLVSPEKGMTQQNHTTTSVEKLEMSDLDDEENVQDESDLSTPETEVTWRVVSEVLDRLFFYLYLVAIGIYDVILIASLQGGTISAVQV